MLGLLVQMQQSDVSAYLPSIYRYYFTLPLDATFLYDLVICTCILFRSFVVRLLITG